MGVWLTPVFTGLVAGAVVALCAFAFRRAAPKWAGGGRLAALIVAAVVAGAAVPVLLRPPATSPAEPADNTLSRLAAALRSAEPSERLAALGELARLTRHDLAKVPEIVELVGGFVRDRAPKADDPRCAASEPDEDVDTALEVLRVGSSTSDEHAVVDLHGACLAHADLRTLDAAGGTLTDANLTGTNLKSADLTRTDLARANLTGVSLIGTMLVDTRFVDTRFADTDLRGAQFSDDTLWPPHHEDAVMAASSYATTTFVIGELVLSDPR